MLVTKKAPNFKAKAINKKNEIIKFNFKKYIKNNICVLFFWPLDFTFVCPSEIIAINNRYKKFKKRKIKIIGISIDSIYVHLAWKNTDIKNGGIGKNIKFIMISDIKREIQKLYNVECKNEGTSLRATFIINKNRIVIHESINDFVIGRNIDEILRIIDAYNLYTKTKFLCPAQWNKNKDTINPTNEGICSFLKKNFKKI